jgi:hypothetical protein
MSRGAGQIEQRIGDLFAATRDRALSIADIADHAFVLNGAPANRKQRLSATRAAHRVLKRVRQSCERSRALADEAHRQTKAALGRERRENRWTKDGLETDIQYETLLHSLPAWREQEKLWEYCERIGVWMRWHAAERRGRYHVEFDNWCTSTKSGRLYFHPPDAPVQVWAVSLDAGGVHWFDAEVVRITGRNVMVRYAGALARLDRRKLWRWWAWYRGVRFVSSRTGRVAQALDELWQDRFGAAGGVPPAMAMPLLEAMALLGVPADYTREDVIAAFRRAVKKAHPDMGGTAEMFRKLVEARDRLLAAIGTSAPAPTMPAYYALGTRGVYRSGRARSRQRLGQTRRLAHG